MNRSRSFIIGVVAAGLLIPLSGFCNPPSGDVVPGPASGSPLHVSSQPSGRQGGASVSSLSGAEMPQPSSPSTTLLDGASSAQVDAVPASFLQQVDPEHREHLPFSLIAPAPGNFTLRGVNPDGIAEFTIRRDRVVSQAMVNLDYTPSPALIPEQSQIKVYLNEELMGVLPITKESLGHRTHNTLAIDPMFLTAFNRVRLEFVGHYRDICENLASTTLWLDIGRTSSIDLIWHSLKLENNLAFFPEPFFDKGDRSQVTIPFVFASQPGKDEEAAAGILASWFGVQSAWRGLVFPVVINHLMSGNALVFLTNSERPDFLRKYPAVSAPQLELMDNPVDPSGKILVVAGRDEHDLWEAAQAVGAGNVLFTGNKIIVKRITALSSRRPYDAPAWVRTDRKVTFRELTTYPEQLQSSGVEPYPIQLSMNLPPDLYLLRNNNIDMKIKYRYTPSPMRDSSRMSVFLNAQFLQTMSLSSKEGVEQNFLLHIPILERMLDEDRRIHIPGLRLGTANYLSFSFNYTNPVMGGTVENCMTSQQVPNHIVIDDTSTLDFSKYFHFMAMPDLRAFADAAFPFSRMADLSETVIVLPDRPTENQLSLYLSMMGHIGARTGLPAMNVSLASMSETMADKNADLLMIGTIPPALTDDRHVDLLVSAAQRWVKTPMRAPVLPLFEVDARNRQPEALATLQASGPLGAVVGFASPFAKQRSVVALLADGPKGYDLLREAFNDSGKRAAMFGSVSIVRESGVNSMQVGGVYYVGHLPWYERIWFALSDHPIFLSVLSAVGVILSTFLLRKGLQIVGHRRAA